MFYIGSHLSFSKGYEGLGKEALNIGANTFQFFTRSPRGGKAKPLDLDDVAKLNAIIEANDFTEKTVIPFATSSSSGLGKSGKLLAQKAGTGDWQEGRRFRSGVSESDVTAWVESLDG